MKISTPQPGQPAAEGSPLEGLRRFFRSVRRRAVVPRLLLGLTLAIAVTRPAIASHEHLNAGAIGSRAGDPLSFVNGDRFAAESGYILPLELAETGPQSGLHRGSLTLTALPATLDYGGPAFGHAALGAHLEVVIDSLTGPRGGAFGFWESAGDGEGTELTFAVPVGTTEGTAAFPLSETLGAPGDDPYGHVHGRVFSADLPGLYRLGLRLRDTSGNGPDGTPLHPESEPFLLQLQAGVSIASIEVVDDEVRIEFGAVSGFDYEIEESDRLGFPEAWTPTGLSVRGDGRLHSVLLPRRPGTQFFRLRRTSF